MKIVIEHGKIKRSINGPFAICLGSNELRELKKVIDKAVQDGLHYGWINIDESDSGGLFEVITRQKPIANTEPTDWNI